MSAVSTAAEEVSTSSIDRVAELRGLSPTQLLDRFKNGTVPETLRVLDGDPPGLVISLNTFTNTGFHRWFKRYSESPTFLWPGKSFRSRSDSGGWGWNRLAIGPILSAFPFEASLGSSVIDGNPSVTLDYNVKRNPFIARRIWDELREIEPGVFLGFSATRIFGRFPINLWFAVDTNAGESTHAV